ncbi:MAG: 6-phosphogluconolactonase [Candidatus Cryptobacteroides sp.]
MITILDTEKEFDITAASRIVDQILRKPDSVIGLSTGRTTGNMHREIVKRFNENPFDVAKTVFVGVDEITNVPKDYYGACYRMLRSELLDGLGIPDERFVILPVQSDNYERDCCNYVKEIEDHGGVDLLILGLGENGHLGFNQPFSPFEIDAWVTDMNPELLARVRNEVGNCSDYKGATMGLRLMMHSKRIILAAKGRTKSLAVKCMIEGEISNEFPASILQMHPNCEFLLDKEAASMLKEQ